MERLLAVVDSNDRRNVKIIFGLFLKFKNSVNTFLHSFKPQHNSFDKEKQKKTKTYSFDFFSSVLSLSELDELSEESYNIDMHEI